MFRAFCLMMFALGFAIIVETLGFNEWVYQNSWIGIPMTIFGGVGIGIYLWR